MYISARIFLFGMYLSPHSECVCVCVKDTDRSSAEGDHSPETFISHYPERERAGEREREGGRDRKRTRGREEMDRSKGQRGVETKEKSKDKEREKRGKSF